MDHPSFAGAGELPGETSGGTRGKLTACIGWHVRYGVNRKALKAIERETGGTSKALQEEPELLPDAVPFWHAFWALSGSRQIGMGIGCIPFSEIAAYVDFHGVSDAFERRVMAEMVQICDYEWLKHQRTKEKARSKKG